MADEDTVGSLSVDSDENGEETDEEKEPEEEEEEEEEEEDDDDEEEEGDSMLLTEEEHTWALAIKEAIEQDPDLSCNDFWCVQLAFKYKGDVEGAMDCVQKLMAFRQEYDVQETADYASTMIQEFVQMFPEFWMALQYSREGYYVLMIDVAKFYGRNILQNERDVQVWLSAFYFSGNAMNPNFKTLRNGTVLLMENEGYDWKQNFDVGLWRKFMTEITSYYPQQHRLIKNYNTGMFMNLLVSMSKPFIPKEMYEKFQMGCQSPMGRLDEVYMQPTIQAANERLLNAYKEALQIRYENEASFSLKQSRELYPTNSLD